jgi:hypothetical protein
MLSVAPKPADLILYELGGTTSGESDFPNLIAIDLTSSSYSQQA